MRIAFAGNPNSGKTTMYNALTGRNERVGNWAGVTVERKESLIKKAYYDGGCLLYTSFSSVCGKMKVQKTRPARERRRYHYEHT